MPSTQFSQKSGASRVGELEVPSTTLDLETKTKRFSTLHSGDKTGTMGWRWTRSPASSPSSPSASNCLRGETGVIGGNQPKQNLLSKARNRRRIPKIRTKTRTVIVTRAVTVDTRVMILTQTKRVRR